MTPDQNSNLHKEMRNPEIIKIIKEYAFPYFYYSER